MSEVKVFEDDKLYTPIEVAKVLRVSKEAVYKWIREGKLPAVKFETTLRILGRDINERLERTGAGQS